MSNIRKMWEKDAKWRVQLDAPSSDLKDHFKIGEWLRENSSDKWFFVNLSTVEFYAHDDALMFYLHYVSYE